MRVADLDENTYGLVLMGIKWDSKEDLIDEMNDWNDSEKFIPDGEFVDFEEIETGLARTDILVKHTGTVNPFKRIENRDMGWVWLSDYIGNGYYAE